MPRLSLGNCGRRSCQQQDVSATETSIFPIAPMGKLLTHLLCFSLAQLRPTLRSTTGGVCRRDLENFPSPHGKMADALALILACATATDASVNYRECVLQRPWKFPSPPWETHVLLLVCREAVSMSRVAQCPSHRAPSVGTHLCALMFKSSHRPHGVKRITCANLAL